MANLSFFAVPAYWVLSMLPHFYAISLVIPSNNGIWENTSPRSTTWDDKIRKITTTATYDTYVRARAAHKNGFDSLPLFTGAILAGNVAKLGSAYMNTFVGWYLTLRVVYTVLYIRTTRQELSQLRSVVWFGSCFWCLGVFVKSGLVLMEE